MILMVTRWCVLGVMVCAAGASDAAGQFALRPNLPAASPSAATAISSEGELQGVVHDDGGRPVAGAVVSALGTVTVFAVSGADGHFAFRTLPAGPYLVRAHLQGYLPEHGRIIQVTPSGHDTWTIALTRLSADKGPKVIAAGVGPVETDPPTAEAGDDHGEVAWRMRHARRSVLKDAEQAIAAVDDQPSFLGDSLSGISRAVGSPARLASSLFGDVPLNAQINLLASTSFDRPQDLFSINAGTPRNIAYVTVMAPTSGGEWTVHGTTTEGDLAAWILAGSYRRTGPAAHRYEAGLSYAAQRYFNGVDTIAVRDTSRNVGSMYAYDNWSVVPRVTVNYGAKYARYDYLADRGLLSPRASVTVQPIADDSLKVRTSISQQETAPGADEFLPPALGVWLPPERTFSSLSRDGFAPERMRAVEVAAEREWAGDVVLGVRAFQQHVDDQVVTLFGFAAPDATSPLAHYQVGSAGAFDAHGWGISASREVTGGVRAAVDYTQADTEWQRGGADRSLLRQVSRSALRRSERVRDLTASVDTVIAPTSTRVFVVYKVNDSFASADALPVAASRFDVQVNQALPFLNFSAAQWEMIFAVRTLFHDDSLDGSIYDELLVVRPPKRILGGVTVRF
jgi:hypothetical protein